MPHTIPSKYLGMLARYEEGEGTAQKVKLHDLLIRVSP